MKLITAVVRPHCLEDIRMAVARTGPQGPTVTEIEQRAWTRPYRGVPGQDRRNGRGRLLRPAIRPGGDARRAKRRC